MEDNRRRDRASGDRNMLPAAARDSGYDQWYDTEEERRQYSPWQANDDRGANYRQWYIEEEERDPEYEEASMVILDFHSTTWHGLLMRASKNEL